MSYSKIIEQLANSEITIETALKRAKLLLHKLGDTKLDEWVNSEIVGYSEDSVLPKYRVITGRLVGNYLKGNSGNYIKFTNASLPIGNVPDEFRKELLTVKFFEGVATLSVLADSRGETGCICKPIPADYYGLLGKYSGNPFITITDARVEVSYHEVATILSCIETKLLDVLIKLEDEFGKLDDLDIDLSNVDQTYLEQVIREMRTIVFNTSIRIGDGNTIKGSDINAQ
ncbi:MAG: hypothetical protein IJK65_10430 [Clostridiales bacterium]|nr:hypothetical protein [Clostridiales bacterium]